ncbi:histamine H3 receptor-like [Protopterus annectens]|uniref:histamine H3 receptor-like n=1 Tax=Protopterus annectens TaxID=7888 RepID=UPI001CFB805E|nr:histamine H3 receptor-like [Protopterus annectens]
MAEDFLIFDLNNSSAYIQNVSSFYNGDALSLQSTTPYFPNGDTLSLQSTTPYFPNGDALSLQSTTPYFSRSIQIILALCISLMISITVIGNGLVILAFFMEKKIRTPRNYFLLNLAICDFFIGAFSIPLYTPYVLSGIWTLGKDLCKVWLITDTLLCFASEFSIVLISYDRFLSIIKALEYQLQQQGVRHVLVKMAAVWVVSFLINCPVITFGEYILGADFIPQDQCYISTLIWSLEITMQVFTFIVPFACTAYFSIKIYWNLRTRSRQKHKKIKRPCDLESSKEKTFSDDVASESNVDHALTIQEPLTPPSAAAAPPPPLPQKVIMNNSGSGANKSQSPLCNIVHLIHRLFNSTVLHLTNHGKLNETRDHNTPDSLKLAKDTKIAKSLAIIVSAYGICWAPFRILMTCRTFDKAHVIKPFWYEISYWMLWFNSCINPVLYPFCHKCFKKAILKIICLKRH